MTMRTMLLAGAIALAPALALAQSAGTVGAGSASGTSGTVGSAGSAAAGGTSASTLGLGARSGDSATIGSAGSAAAAQGRATSSTKLHDNNPNNLHGMSKARAQDGGTWSKSMTKTKVKNDTLSSRTKSMSHQPGGPPTKSTTNQSVTLGQ
jgi:hypothetical protein